MKDHFETKHAILKAAIDEFAEYGIGNARTSSIAKRAGVASGLLHYHFGTKANLYSEILNNFFDISALDKLIIMPFQKECSPLEKIQLILYAMSKWMSASWSYNLIRFYFRLMADGKEEIRDILQKYSFSSERYMASIIKEGVKQGIFNIKHYYFFVFDTMHMLNHHLALYHMLDDEPEQEEFFTRNHKTALQEYFLDSSIRKIINPAKVKSIKPVSRELTAILDKYIDGIDVKNNFSSWTLVIRLLAKLFNDQISTGSNKNEK